MLATRGACASVMVGYLLPWGEDGRFARPLERPFAQGSGLDKAQQRGRPAQKGWGGDDGADS